MDSPAYSMPGIAQITQLSPTSYSVITLGQLAHVPLMWSPSELSYGSEPHDQFTTAVDGAGYGVSGGRGGGVPGVVLRWGTGRVLYLVLT